MLYQILCLKIKFQHWAIWTKCLTLLLSLTLRELSILVVIRIICNYFDYFRLLSILPHFALFSAAFSFHIYWLVGVLCMLICALAIKSHLNTCHLVSSRPFCSSFTARPPSTISLKRNFITIRDGTLSLQLCIMYTSD